MTVVEVVQSLLGALGSSARTVTLAAAAVGEFKGGADEVVLLSDIEVDPSLSAGLLLLAMRPATTATAIEVDCVEEIDEGTALLSVAATCG